MHPKPTRRARYEAHRTCAMIAILLIVPLVKAQTKRVLFIGNSYTQSNNLPNMVRQLALSMGDTLVTQMVAPGGFTFEGHSTNSATLTAIDQGNWHHVVLQEQSQLPAFSPGQVAQQVLPYAAELVDRIRTSSPCAEPVFLMTWGRENGDQQNCAVYPPVCTYEGMQQRLWESYVLMAGQNAAHCAPAGSTWRSYREAHPVAALYTDGSHPNVLGSYIAATTLYATLFRRSCASAAYVPAGLDLGTAAEVRALASTTVLDSLAAWNIGVNDPTALADHQVVEGLSVLFANNSIGGVQQWWSFGDGGTSTDTDPLHTYPAAGLYTATLVVEDDCGRRDSLSFAVDLSSVGLPERTSVAVIARVEGGMLVVEHSTAGGTLELRDALGRLLLRAQLRAGGTERIALSRLSMGVCTWQVRSTTGEVHGGRVLLP
jgi:hypothetical protein